MQLFIHYFLHLLFPGVIAFIFFRKDWVKSWFLLLATMLVDIDHLFANPVFDPNRCSIGFHWLHSYYAIAIYVVLFIVVKKRTIRILTLGLILHMITDYIDCLWMR
jgi:hypothetical protein